MAGYIGKGRSVVNVDSLVHGDNLDAGDLINALPAIDGSALTGIVGTQTGVVYYYAASTAPTGFLKANGATISRSTYADLFAVVGTTYGAGDGSTTFTIPDLRGEFLRGWDDARGVDTSRAFGSAQADELESHQHIGGFSRASPFGYASGRYGVDVTGAGSQHSSTSAGTYTQHYPKTSLEGGTETRPRNIALLACIKY